jgi:DNA-binding IclR family transcriptional regulator
MGMPKKKRKSAPVGVITKVLRILELLGRFPDGLQLKEVAAMTGINKSTALRFLSHLERENYLLRDTSGAYLLGLKLVMLGGDRSFEKMLCKISRPILEDLRKTTSEAVNLAVLEGTNILHIDILESPHSFSVLSQVGQTGEIYCTALGKAIIAHMEDGPRKDEIFASMHFVAKTPRTLMSIARLKEDLAQTKKQGFSHDDEEAFAGARCIGAPIFGPDGNVIAALSVSGPISRMPKHKLFYFGGLARQAADEIAASIGRSSENTGEQPGDTRQKTLRRAPAEDTSPSPKASAKLQRSTRRARGDQSFLASALTKSSQQINRRAFPVV